MALLCFLAYGATLRSASFIRDDWPIVAQNPLLRQRGGVLKVWTTGYWQAFQGRAATVDEWRPIAMLSHALDSALFKTPGPMHLQNLLLHAAVCLLLFELLRRRHGEEAAWLGACLSAVLPVHVEAVASLVGRSELLAALWTLAAWLVLDRSDSRRARALGAAAFVLGALSKENALLFPALLALSDWTFHGRRPWDARRRGTYTVLAAAGLAVLAARTAVLGPSLRVGASYFEGVGLLQRLLTLARFWTGWYLWPSLSGFPLAYDFSRPLLPDSTLGDPRAWLCLTALAAAASCAAAAFARRRSKAAFWVLVFCLFLLPTSHLLVPLDAIGAQRFLYLPSIALAAAAAAAWQAWAGPRREGAWTLAVLLIAFYGIRTARACGPWTEELRYYTEVVTFNPVSARARLGLGGALRQQGDGPGAAREFTQAARLDPRLPAPHYNLGLMAWEKSRLGEARERFERSVALVSGYVPGLVMLGAVHARLGHDRRAEGLLLRALSLQPDEAAARYNLGALYLRNRRPEAREHLARFIELAPDDPDAPRVRALLGLP